MNTATERAKALPAQPRVRKSRLDSLLNVKKKLDRHKCPFPPEVAHKFGADPAQQLCADDCAVRGTAARKCSRLYVRCMVVRIWDSANYVETWLQYPDLMTAFSVHSAEQELMAMRASMYALREDVAIDDLTLLQLIQKLRFVVQIIRKRFKKHQDGLKKHLKHKYVMEAQQLDLYTTTRSHLNLIIAFYEAASSCGPSADEALVRQLKQVRIDDENVAPNRDPPTTTSVGPPLARRSRHTHA